MTVAPAVENWSYLFRNLWGPIHNNFSITSHNQLHFIQDLQTRINFYIYRRLCPGYKDDNAPIGLWSIRDGCIFPTREPSTYWLLDNVKKYSICLHRFILNIFLYISNAKNLNLFRFKRNSAWISKQVVCWKEYSVLQDKWLCTG